MDFFDGKTTEERFVNSEDAFVVLRQDFGG